MFSRVRNPFLTLLLSYHVWVTSKIQVNFRYRRYLKVLMILSYTFLEFLHYSCFRGQGIHFWYSYWATMFGWPWKSRSTSGTEGTWRFWWFCLIDFHNFFSIYVLEVKEFIFDIPTELPCLGDLKNRGPLPVQKVLDGSDDFVLWIFTISQYLCFRGQGIHFWYSYWATVFGDLENRGQLPVQKVLDGSDDFVLWIFTISSVFMFSRSRNLLLTFPLSCLCSGDLENPGQLPVQEVLEGYWWLCLIDFWKFFTIYVFEVMAEIPTERPCSGDLENLGQLRGSVGTDDFVLWIFTISSLFMFLRFQESIADISTELSSLGNLENL